MLTTPLPGIDRINMQGTPVAGGKLPLPASSDLPSFLHQAVLAAFPLTTASLEMCLHP